MICKVLCLVISEDDAVDLGAGLSDRLWDLGDIVKLIEAYEAKNVSSY
jgi:hypothetical protein